MERNTFTMEDAMAIQAHQLAEWEYRLKPEHYAELAAKVAAKNAKGYKSPYDVFRGIYIDGIVNNIRKPQ